MPSKKTPKELILARAKELTDAHNYETPLEYNRALRYYLNEVANVMSPYAIPATGMQTEEVEVPDSMLKRDGYGNLPKGDNQNNVATHTEMGDKSFSENVSSSLKAGIEAARPTIKAGIEGAKQMFAPAYNAVKGAVDVYSGQAAIDEYGRVARLNKEQIELLNKTNDMSEQELKALHQTIDSRKATIASVNNVSQSINDLYESAHNAAQSTKEKQQASHDEWLKHEADFNASQEEYKKQSKQKQDEMLADSEARAKAKVQAEYSGKSPDEVLAHYAKKYNRPDYMPASMQGKDEASSLPTPAKDMSPYSIEAYNARKKASMEGRAGSTSASTR